MAIRKIDEALIDADTLDGKHYSDIATEIDNDIAGGFTLIEGKAVNFISILTTADHTYYGITRNIVAGEALTHGNVVYQKAADGEWWKAKGDAYATVKGNLCLVVADIADGATGVGLVIGGYRHDAETWTTQNEIWVSKATAGLVTDTQPATPAFIRNIGHAEAAHMLYFNGLCTVVVEV